MAAAVPGSRDRSAKPAKGGRAGPAGVERLRAEGWMEVWADGLDHSLVKSIYQAMDGQKVRTLWPCEAT